MVNPIFQQDEELLLNPFGSKYLPSGTYTDVNSNEFVVQEDAVISVLTGGDASIAENNIDYKASMSLSGVTLKKGALIVAPVGEAFKSITIDSGAIMVYDCVIEGQKPVPFVGFLDLYPDAAAAFSYFKLRSDYEGNCIKIRRDSVPSADLDIGFVDNYLDVAAIATFCGSNNGFLVTDYDQSYNENNKTQAQGSKQPKIYDGSTGMMTLNGKESKLYESAHVMNLNNSILVKSVFIVNNVFTKTIVNYIFGDEGVFSSGLIAQGSNTGIDGLSSFDGTEIRTLGNLENSSQTLNIVTVTSSDLRLGINGDPLSSFVTMGDIYAKNVGNRVASSDARFSLNGNIQFEAYYTTDQSTNVPDIQAFLNSHYNIYAEDILEFNPYNIWDSEHITIDGTTTTIHDFNTFGDKIDMSNPSASNQPTYNAASANFNGLPSFTFDGVSQYVKGDIVDYRTTDTSGVVVNVFRHLSGVFLVDLTFSQSSTSLRYISTAINTNSYRTLLTLTDSRSFRGNTNIVTGSPSSVVAYADEGSSYAMNINGNSETITMISGSNDGEAWFNGNQFDNVSIGAIIRSTGLTYGNLEWCMSGYFPYTDESTILKIVNFLKNKYGVA